MDVLRIYHKQSRAAVVDYVGQSPGPTGRAQFVSDGFPVFHVLRLCACAASWLILCVVHNKNTAPASHTSRALITVRRRMNLAVPSGSLTNETQISDGYRERA